MKLYKFFLVALVVLAAAGAQAQVAVIANKSVPEESIQISKLNDIYSLRQKTWSNGSIIIPVTLKSDNEVSRKFFDAFGMSSMEMKKLWMRAQLTGEGQPPEGMNSTDEILDKVASTPGAIGYVEADKVNAKVKVLLTIE
ncbi:MAG TPA: hypothetical protein VLX91_06930 [Candidatus Acidoferrales bacterium]|nr:hypothetical protein [Candidatus Acidoferrales bacterium]